MDPAAPGRFSTIIGTPSLCISPGETSRATASVEPPGPKGTTMRMELDCARAGRMAALAKAPKATRRVNVMNMLTPQSLSAYSICNKPASFNP
jgi:hypothetical protein